MTTDQITDEDLVAFLDGEASEELSARIAQALARLLVRGFGPEQSSQMAAWVVAFRVEGKVGEQGTDFVCT